MRATGPYGEHRACGAETGSRIEEEPMYSQMLQGMAAERTKDLRREAVAAAQARQARDASPGRRAGVVAAHASAGLARRTVHP